MTGIHGSSRSRRSIFASTILLSVAAWGCGGEPPGGPLPSVGEYPILFAGQVPVTGFGVMSSTFGNHLASMKEAPRGGGLYLRSPKGDLRNLTAEAGFGEEGIQGQNAIAVREPSVHWSGEKALFSMAVGAPDQFQVVRYTWQIYEVTGLGDGQTAAITKVAFQPEGFNNVSPLYGTDDRVLFTSDRPRSGPDLHLYPQLDEYESHPTVVGLYSLDPVSGDLFLVNHTASGVFTPIIDSKGRVIFTKWDHLQRDQQAAADKYENAGYGSFNYSDESAGAQELSNNDEYFPEPRFLGEPELRPNERPHQFNQFIPWQINEDGTEEETLDHVGRNELGGSYVDGVFTDDPNLTYLTPESYHKNRFYVDGDGGFFHIKEDPASPGVYYATNAREFGTDAAGGIVRVEALTGDADDIVVTPITPASARNVTDDNTPSDPSHPGHFRNPLPLSDGSLVAVHAPGSGLDALEGPATSPKARYALRLKIVKDGVASDLLTAGITVKVSYYDPDQLITYEGELWELDPVEVRPRLAPPTRVSDLPAPEAGVLQAAGVDASALKAWMRDRGLALVVSRNVTSRDRADVQQPFNLRVPGGAESVPVPGKVYDIAWMQLLQGDQIRGYKTFQAGRRVLAQPMHDVSGNPAAPGAAPGSVAIGADGSVAAFVPARRAMTWQLLDPAGLPVVRERNWVSFAPGEIRACPTCHGINTEDQLGRVAPENPPAALADLLSIWKQSNP